MKVQCNGEVVEVDDGTTVGQLVDGRAEDRRGVAVAVDGEVVPRGGWDDHVLEPDASIEVVGAVQGGA